MGYLRTVSLFLSFLFSFSPPSLIPSFSPPSYSMLSCSLILPLPPADPAAHPPPLTPSFLRYLISFSHPPSRHGRAASPHRLKAPGCPRPSSPAPNPAPSAIDTPMRGTPRQGRCASHNGRRCRDSRGEERGPTDSRVAAGERARGSSPARRRKRESRLWRKSLRTEARGRKRAETEKSRVRERGGKKVRERETSKKRIEWEREREARKKKRKEEREGKRKRSGKTEGRKRCARGRGKERPEQDSERRQRPFFDKLVTRRHPAAKGAEGSSPAQGGKRRGGRRSSWPKGEGRVAGRSVESGTGGGRLGTRRVSGSTEINNCIKIK